MFLLQHKWKYFNSVLEKSVSRSDFMSVLGNIEYVVIKASYGSRLQQSRYRCTPALHTSKGHMTEGERILVSHSLLFSIGSQILPWKRHWRKRKGHWSAGTWQDRSSPASVPLDTPDCPVR